MSVKKLTELAMLTAVALIIFVVELQIPNPFPIPGVKLGLANIITVYAVYRYRFAETLLIVATRVLLGAIFSGSMMTLLYSMTGGLLCLVGMTALKRRLPGKYIWVCSVFGAIFHNVGQIAVVCLVAGRGMLLYFPFLLVSGCLAGAFTGLCAQFVIRRFETNILSHR
ncbi:MAG TPA: Gx transporter family protein [Candidatus Choladousia intestinavium]|uniref:Gx transporter family protein n=1 Tax=Candidatus Choladousia intestinavium TaxID=2840727 RepID=A0A9D1D8K9_9FIRM|nr:Gx transporter family protein [Candidatus Choladousia intestinavium]